jgi:hypothetical protein
MPVMIKINPKILQKTLNTVMIKSPKEFPNLPAPVFILIYRNQRFSIYPKHFQIPLTFFQY